MCRPALPCRSCTCTAFAYSESMPTSRCCVCASEKSVGPNARTIFEALRAWQRQREVRRSQRADDLRGGAGLAGHVVALGAAALVLLAPELERRHVRPSRFDELAVGRGAGVDQV